MSRVFFGLEKGLDIYGENNGLEVRILTGTATPTGTGEQADAPIGSLYIRSGVGEIYQKVDNLAVAGDWELNGSSSAVIGKWRNERVIAVTGETLSAGSRDLVANPFTDDEAPTLTAADFLVGQYVIGGSATAPVLYQVTAVAAPSITLAVASPALIEDDTFVVDNYLPDSPDSQEGPAILNFNGSQMVKLGDLNWNFADGINLAAGYSPVNGSITSADTVNSAIEKLDGNQADLVSLSGVAQGAVNLGTFTGVTIPDDSTNKQALQALETAQEGIGAEVDDLVTLSGVAVNSTDLGTFTGVTIPDGQTVKQALQSLETAHEEVDQNVNDLITLSGVAENATTFGAFAGSSLADDQNAKQLFERIEVLLEQMRGVSVAGITTVQTVDQVPTASVKACKWLVEVFEVAAPANRQALEVYALNNGTLVDDTVFAKLKLGANFNLSVSVDVSAGNMRLRVASTSAGVTVTARRIEVVQSVL